jgi:lipopolysaccharide/colanic/teichoic acid biosynthesis glycosyltransferase
MNGRLFWFYKFRSMHQDAEERLLELMAFNEAQGPIFKIRQDPRITRVGTFLRRTSLDEFPQFWNVLRGEMSIVGPRPPIPAEVQKYERWQRRRLSMKPGITCIWQVSGRSELGFDRWMELDLEYIDNWSLWHDLKILAKTVPAVLTGRGAH